MKNDLKALSDKQLKKLKTDIDKELKSRQTQKLSDARKAVEEVAKKHGFSLNDVLGAKSKARKVPAAAKYRNPDDASQTWSGRGRQPAWYKSAIAAGKSPDDMAV